MDVADLFVALAISNQPVVVTGYIVVSASRECFLVGVLTVNEPARSTQTMTQEYSVRFCYFGWEQTIFLACMILLCPLIVNKCKISNQFETSCVIPGQFMVFLILFSVLVCKYSWYQERIFYLVSQS
jgi:hypothetical protein